MRIASRLLEKIDRIMLCDGFIIQKGDPSINSLFNFLEKLVKKFRKFEVDDFSVGSTPDTSKFRAQLSGAIDLVTNTSLSVIDSEQFVVAVKIGGGFPKRREVVKLIEKAWKTRFEKKLGNVFSLGTTDGRNFAFIGIQRIKN